MLAVPAELQKKIADARWHPITIGFSGAQTFRLEAPNGRSTYLKTAELGSPYPLKPEAACLEWLQGRLRVPQLLSYQVDHQREYLWTSELRGQHGAEPLWATQLPQLVQHLARGLRQIHSITDCPIDRRLHIRVKEAERNVALGLVDETNFDRDRQGCTARDLYAELVKTVPPGEDLVFTHGDYCLPNIVISGEQVGFIDWGNGGVADRYQDLALAVRSLDYNFGPGLGEPFLKAYGLDQPDWAKIEFYQLLDEFF